VRALIRTPTLDAASSNGSRGQEGHADRRQASKTIVLGGLTASLASVEALERITAHGDRRVDSALVADHEDLAAIHADAYCSTRPEALGEAVVAHAHSLASTLQRPMR
jgi:hypothetical protein